MKRFATLVAVLAVVGLVAFSGGAGFAQDDHKHKEGPKGEHPDHPEKPDCGHDFKALHEKMKLTDEQKAKLDEIRKAINEETKGNNRCVIEQMIADARKAGKDSEEAKQIKEKVEKMREVIKTAMEKFEKEREALLTDEQKKLHEEMKAMMKEHREKCMGGEKGPRPGKDGGKGDKPEGKHPPMKEGHHKCDDAANDGVFHHHGKDHPGKGPDEESKS